MESPPGLLPFYGRSLGGDICVIWLQPGLCGAARKVTSATLFVSVKFFNTDSHSRVNGNIVDGNPVEK
jgi:hypothetical protein